MMNMKIQQNEREARYFHCCRFSEYNYCYLICIIVGVIKQVSAPDPDPIDGSGSNHKINPRGDGSGSNHKINPHGDGTGSNPLLIFIL